MSIHSLSLFLPVHSWLDQLKTSSCLCVWTATRTEQMTWRWSPAWSRSDSNPKFSSTTTCYASGLRCLSFFVPNIQWLTLNGGFLPIFQRAAECSQRQPGHHGEACDLQWAVQCQESKQHASPPHSAAAQPWASAKGEIKEGLGY